MSEPNYDDLCFDPEKANVWVEDIGNIKDNAVIYLGDDYKLKKENEQLKDLLKECQYILKEQNFYRNTSVETDATYRTRCLKKQEVLKRIDEVLK